MGFVVLTVLFACEWWISCGVWVLWYLCFRGLVFVLWFGIVCVLFAFWLYFAVLRIVFADLLDLRVLVFY